MEIPRLKKISVRGLQGSFDYTIEFPHSHDAIILIAPNGHGKTAFLSLINACLQYNLASAARHRFSILEVVFADGSKRIFEKVSADTTPPQNRKSHRHGGRSSPSVKVRAFDKRGKEQQSALKPDLSQIPMELLSRAIDRSVPYMQRIDYDLFRDVGTQKDYSISQLLDNNFDKLLNDDLFVHYLEKYEPASLTVPEDRVNCVFIETQRLLYQKRSERQGEKGGPEEEISRQAQHLADSLKTTLGNYASTSQQLDRSFPSRIVAAASQAGPANIDELRGSLNAIEERRNALTQAGILVEGTENVIPPESDIPSALSAVFRVYIEDSKTKLSTFDDIYKKVSVFRELIKKKLWRKELLINRESGVEIRAGKDKLNITELSSGEKHEFVMLFKLIFETPANSVVLIDEPEISLHVAWQLEFLDDLLQIQRINPFQSIIATHSPQIIQAAEDVTFDLAAQVK